MRRTLARAVLRTGVSKLDEINVAKEAFARAEEHRGYRQIQLIDESGAKILLNGGDAASDTNVFPIRGRGGSLEGAVDAIRHEGEDPLAQRLPADAHRILEALLRSRSESVNGNGKAHFALGHGLPPPSPTSR